MNLIEDKNFGGNKPYIDLTDATRWSMKNIVIPHIGEENWRKIEEHVKSRVAGECEFCGASEFKQGLFGQKAHKFKIELRYSTDNNTKIATLRRLIYTCVSCSQSIHLRQTQLQGINQYKKAVDRLCKFHNLDPYQIKIKLEQELAAWQYRHEMQIPENLEVYIIENGTTRLWH